MRTIDARLIVLIGGLIWCLFLVKGLVMLSRLMGWV